MNPRLALPSSIKPSGGVLLDSANCRVTCSCLRRSAHSKLSPNSLGYSGNTPAPKCFEIGQTGIQVLLINVHQSLRFHNRLLGLLKSASCTFDVLLALVELTSLKRELSSMPPSTQSHLVRRHRLYPRKPPKPFDLKTFATAFETTSEGDNRTFGGGIGSPRAGQLLAAWSRASCRTHPLRGIKRLSTQQTHDTKSKRCTPREHGAP